MCLARAISTEDVTESDRQKALSSWIFFVCVCLCGVGGL